MRSFRCRAGRPPDGQAPTCPPPDPIRRLLRQLRTRQVTLLVAGRELQGRLISLDPVTLVGADGTAIVVRVEAIDAVIF